VAIEPLSDGTVEITAPQTGERLRVGQDVITVALLIDGSRSAEDIVEAAALEGVTVAPQAVRALGQQLQARGLLAPPQAMAPQLPRLRPMPTLKMANLGRPAAAARPTQPAAEPGLDAASLATALVLLRDHRYAEARQSIEPVLARNPENAQAQVLLQLVATEAQRAEAARRRRRLVRLLVAGSVGLSAVTALLVPVPERMHAPCAIRPLDVGRVVGPPFAAQIKELRVSKETLVEAGQIVAVLADDAAAPQLARLRAAITVDDDLLRIMRTGGTDEDERESRRAVEQLTDQLEELGRCASGDAACVGTRERISAALEIARTKRKYCEWKAFPEEVAAVEQRQKKQRAQEQELLRRQRTEVRSPLAGVVVEVARGPALPAGAEIARLIDAGRFEVEIANARPPEKGSAIEVAQRKEAVVQTYYGKAQDAETRGTKLLLRLAADTRKVSFGGVCEATLTPGRVLLGVALWRKIAGH
jgi:multidrug efflux pump subunit AcrA (membrane-fusion protein)